MTLVLGTAAGAFLAAGLIPLATSPVANACSPDDSPGARPRLYLRHRPTACASLASRTSELPTLTTILKAMILNIPSLGITDVLTSGTDPSDDLAAVGVTLPDDIGLGMAGVTVNTFTDSMDPALDSSFTIPFEDPLAQLWDFLVANAFFGL